MCNCDIGPGKFEGEGVETFLAWEMVMDGGGDDITGGEGGDGPTTDWIESPRFGESLHVESAQLYGYCDDCIMDAVRSRPAGVAVWESDQGFVSCRLFETKAEYDKALAECQEADVEAAEQEDFWEDSETEA